MRPLQRIQRAIQNSEPLLRLLLIGAASGYILSAAWVTLSRLAYPFELEWMEGGSLLQMRRILDGLPIYTAPSLDYTPYIYTPLYYYLSALAARILANEWFLPLRLVSLSASAGILLIIYDITARQSASRLWGLVSAGFFAATFRLGGAWFDIARVDMLAAFFSLAALWVALSATRRGAALAGLMGALALLTKQTTFPILFICAAYLFFFRSRQAGAITLVTFLLPSALWIWLENQASNGWFLYYTQTLPTLHGLLQPVPLLLIFRAGQIITPVLIAFWLGTATWLKDARHLLVSDFGFISAASGGLIATSLLSAVNIGAFNNTFIPAYIGISLLLGCGAPLLTKRAALTSPNLALLLILQFALLYYPLTAQIPTPADRQSGDEMIAALAAAPGPVWIPHHPAMALRAGKKPSAHLSALFELQGFYGQPDSSQWPAIQAELDTRLRQKEFALLVFSEPTFAWIKLNGLYQPAPAIPYPSTRTFMPVTGAWMRPTFWYTPTP